MKKVFLMVAMTLFAIMARSAEYQYLVFTNTEGTNTALSVNNLTLKINGSQLEVTNDDGSIAFVLTDLKAMQFSTDGVTLALENVLNADAPVEVLTVTGVSLGSFDNLRKAASSLKQGVYVITDGKNTQKIVLQ